MSKIDNLRARYAELETELSEHIAQVNGKIASMTKQESDKALADGKEIARNLADVMYKINIEGFMAEPNPAYAMAKVGEYGSPECVFDKNGMLVSRSKTRRFKAVSAVKDLSCKSDWYYKYVPDLFVRLLTIAGVSIGNPADLTTAQMAAYNTNNAAYEAHLADNSKPNPYSDTSLVELLTKIYIDFVGDKFVNASTNKEMDTIALKYDVLFMYLSLVSKGKESGELRAMTQDKFADMVIETMNCKINGKPYKITNKDALSEARKNAKKSGTEPKAEPKSKSKKPKTKKAKATETEPQAEPEVA